jgi:four helix bundle protein
MIHKFENLECCKSAYQFNIDTFSMLDKNILNNHWSLRNQLSRASLSIMNNIAEGYGRFGDKDKIRFFNISHSSCNEVKSMLYLINGLQYINPTEFTKLFEELELSQKLILGYIRYLNKR